MPGYWNAHSDRDWEDQLHEPPGEDDEGLSPEDERLAEGLLNSVRSATAVLYPEARIPETAMPRDMQQLLHRIERWRRIAWSNGNDYAGYDLSPGDWSSLAHLLHEIANLLGEGRTP